MSDQPQSALDRETLAKFKAEQRAVKAELELVSVRAALASAQERLSAYERGRPPCCMSTDCRMPK